MPEISLKHKIALGLIPGIGDINARKLVSHLGSVEAVFSEPHRNLVKIRASVRNWQNILLNGHTSQPLKKKLNIFQKTG